MKGYYSVGFGVTGGAFALGIGERQTDWSLEVFRLWGAEFMV